MPLRLSNKGNKRGRSVFAPKVRIERKMSASCSKEEEDERRRREKDRRRTSFYMYRMFVHSIRAKEIGPTSWLGLRLLLLSCFSLALYLALDLSLRVLAAPASSPFKILRSVDDSAREEREQ